MTTTKGATVIHSPFVASGQLWLRMATLARARGGFGDTLAAASHDPENGWRSEIFLDAHAAPQVWFML
ncbi:hypothetical protein [Paraburkholderia steynii]|uniref:hypothetical protein n=1 Tax=Paraburkholderia steynii TaxID=1245441 RepID=UPI000B81BFBF|nr:hypothetical protein [Paraburkholderia steynii]